MPRAAATHPTELELEILKVLWEEAPLPVREIRQRLAARGRDLAHTTIITTLNVMVRKRYATRTMAGKACLFAPRVAHAQVSRNMLKDLVRRVFDGSAPAVVLSLFDVADIQQEDLHELKQIIKQRSQQ
ncbi:MAG: BlaI/MecI/CopY family transcriptional regulator [Planctomycetaceae bacterium]